MAFRIFLIGFSFFMGLQNAASQSVFDRFKDRVVKRKYHRQIKRIIAHQNKSRSAEYPATPDGFWQQEYIATMNPKLGRPTPENLLQHVINTNITSVNKRATPGGIHFKWEERGPNKIGGRTRAIAWDPSTINKSNKKVWAGAVSGGLWYNNNIGSTTSKWQSVSNLWPNLTVTCIAFDPLDSSIMYVGTGEGYSISNNGSTRGYGVFKSTDGGWIWNHLTATAGFEFVNDIVVRKEIASPKLGTYRSVIYLGRDVHKAGHVRNGDSTTAGLYRSINGGNSFNKVNLVLPGRGISGAPDKIELDARNNLWVSTKNNVLSSYSKTGGGIYFSSNGTSFSQKYKHEKTSSHCVISCAPSGKDTIYGLIAGTTTIKNIIRSYDYGNSWDTLTLPVDADTGINNEFTNGQAWYNLAIATNPRNAKEVIIGGIDLFRTKNGGSNWKQISRWSQNNANLHQLNCSYTHADQHAILYHPSENKVLFGNDGGIFYLGNSNVNLSNTANAIWPRNNHYLVTQFYCGDMSMIKGSNYMIAGAQDNGTSYINSPGLNNRGFLRGGDGGFCMVSELDEEIQINSYVYNSFWYTTNSWANHRELIREKSGLFINPADLDYVNNFLFSCKDEGTIYGFDLSNATSNPRSISFKNLTNGVPSCIYAYKRKSNGKSRLLVGTHGGDIVVSDGNHSFSSSYKKISTGLNTGYVSSIYSHNKSDDTLFVTFSNYGVKNIYLTTNGGSSWKAIDGNLPDIPVWDIVTNTKEIGSAIIATEIGIFSCENIFGKVPLWKPAKNGMGSVKVRTLKYRPSDQTIMATTHGRGIFTSIAWGKNVYDANFSLSDTVFCVNEKISLRSTNSDADSVRWNVIPNNSSVKIANKNALNTTVTISKAGSYILSLLSFGDVMDNGKNYIRKSVAINVLKNGTLNTGILRVVVDKDPLKKKIINKGQVAFYSINNNADSITWYSQGPKDGKPTYMSSSESNSLTLFSPYTSGLKVWPVLHSSKKCIDKKSKLFDAPFRFAFGEIERLNKLWCQYDTLRWINRDTFNTRIMWELYDKENELQKISKSNTFQTVFDKPVSYTLVLKSFMDSFYSEINTAIDIRPSTVPAISDIVVTDGKTKLLDYCWKQNIILEVQTTNTDSIQWYIDNYDNKYTPIKGGNRNQLPIEALIPSGKQIAAQAFSDNECVIPPTARSKAYVLQGNGQAPILKRDLDSLIVTNANGQPIAWYKDDKFLTTTKEPFLIVTSNGKYHCVFRKDTCDSPESKGMEVSNVSLDQLTAFGWVYPNPSRDIMRWNSKFSGYLYVHDYQGSLLKTIDTKNGKESVIDIRDLAPGMYLLSGKNINQRMLFSNYKLIKSE
ncbi:hypothetical protein N9M15_05820 [Bacteroidia bacterium]|nr:hypothetical protein [Bacteroidia bacterium]